MEAPIGLGWSLANFFFPGASRFYGANERAALKARLGSSGPGALVTVRYPMSYDRLRAPEGPWRFVEVLLEGSVVDRFSNGWSGPTWVPRSAGETHLAVRPVGRDHKLLETTVSISSGGPTLVAVIPAIERGFLLRGHRPARTLVSA